MSDNQLNDHILSLILDYLASNVRVIVSGVRLIVLKSVQIMATPEERRSADHLIHDVTIDELQQLTDLHVQQVSITFIYPHVEAIA